jgi:hypothetical protein
MHIARAGLVVLGTILGGCSSGSSGDDGAIGGVPAPPPAGGGASDSPPARVDAGSDTGKAAATDEAQILSATLPDQLSCTESRAATVTVKNTGSATWTRAGGYKLAAVSDKDVFDPDARVLLKESDSVAPGATYEFSVPMHAPLTAGVAFDTSWRMLHEGVRPFGGTASHHVAVGCPGEPALAKAQIYNSPLDVASWPATTKITQLDIRADGVALAFSKKDGADRWPDITPPGWDGPIQYTLWILLSIKGQWAASGIIQFWYGLPASGGDITQNNQIAKNWVYDGRWGSLAGHQPAPGEAVGFMVTAGNARGVLDASQSIRERSDMVIVAFPGTAGATFKF